MQCLAPDAVLLGDVAYVLCHEALGGHFLTATNIFIRHGRQWRLQHHHAGPAASPPETTEFQPGPVN